MRSYRGLSVLFAFLIAVFGFWVLLHGGFAQPAVHAYGQNAGAAISPAPQMAAYNWSQNPAGSISAGQNELRLSPCPKGIDAAQLTPKAGNAPFLVYLPDHGAAEAVPVSGGDCRSGAASGTILISAQHAHSEGFTVQSASSGLQEMLSEACDTMAANGLEAGGSVQVRGIVALRAETFVGCSNLTVDLDGALLQSYVEGAAALYVGIPSHSAAVYNVTLIDPRGQAEVAGNQHPFIEVNAQRTRIFNLGAQAPRRNSHATWSSYLQVDDDQAFLLDGFDTNWGANGGGNGLRCDASVCDSYITTGPGFAVGWLKHMNISAGYANCVDWQSGNTLHVSDSVCQDFSEFGFRGGTARGGYFGMELENVYFENGGANPIGNVGKASIIEQGLTVELSGPFSSVMSTGRSVNNFPDFSPTGGHGNIRYQYYIVPHHPKYGAGNALLAGMAATNGSGNITVSWPDIPGLAGIGTYDVLRITLGGGETQGPYGTGNWAVSTGLAEASVCKSGLCSTVDKQVPLASYAVPRVTYYPMLNYWPGTVVLSASMDGGDINRSGSLLSPVSVAGINSVAGPNRISVSADFCSGGPAQSSPLLMSCASDAVLAATLMPAGGGAPANSKGRLNFGPPNGRLPAHVVTWADSDWQKTAAAEEHRPANDTADAYTGFDQNGGLMNGAPASISNYIGNAGDGSSWLERLSSSGKTFKVPIATPPAKLALATAAIAANSCAAPQSAKLAGANSSSVIKWSFSSNPVGVGGYGTGALQISTFPTQNTANIVVCNISNHAITPGAIGVNLRLEE